MFSFREFLKKGFLSAVGKMADYQIRLNACGYFEKNVLTVEDLAEIDAAIDAQYIVPEETEEVEPGEMIEETPVENTEEV